MNSSPFPPPPVPGIYAPGRTEPVYYSAPQRTNYAKVVALGAIALLAAIALVVLVVVLRSSSGGVGTPAPVSAVCQPGSYTHNTGREVPTFQGSTDVAVCTGIVPWTSEDPTAQGFNPNDRYGSIWIVQFPSPGAARNDAATESMMAATAIGTVNGKTVLFVAPADWTGASLQPLIQFGFTVTPAR